MAPGTSNTKTNRSGIPSCGVPLFFVNSYSLRFAIARTEASSGGLPCAGSSLASRQPRAEAGGLVPFLCNLRPNLLRIQGFQPENRPDKDIFENFALVFSEDHV